MPDWVAHIAVAWAICTVLGFKYREFNTPNTVIVMLGSVLPDIVKVGLITEYFNYAIWDFIWPMHLPIGSLVIAGMTSLFFKEKKKIFLFLALGIATHFGLDLLLRNLSGGIALFFPFYFGQWQLDLVATDSFYTTIIALIIALVVYLVSLRINKSRGESQV